MSISVNNSEEKQGVCVNIRMEVEGGEGMTEPRELDLMVGMMGMLTRIFEELSETRKEVSELREELKSVRRETIAKNDTTSDELVADGPDYNMPAWKLGLSRRLEAALARWKENLTVRDIIETNEKSRHELSKIRGVGVAALHELEIKMRNAGFTDFTIYR